MVTIKEIARDVGISPSTVSIVLGGNGEKRKISAETQKAVLAAAGRLGYQPNIAARRLRGGGDDELLIAMFWAQDFRAGMMVRFWDGLRHALEQSNRKVRLVIYPYTNDHLNEVQALTSASNCHGAIICNASYADLEFLQDTRPAIPIVLYNRTCPNYSSVVVDDARMGALAARALADQGCKSAAVLTSQPVFEGMEVRVQGFILEGQRHGLEISKIRYCENSLRGGCESVLRGLNDDWKQRLPDGLFCGSSMLALGAISAFSQSGLCPKQQPRVVAIGNGAEDYDKYCIPSLSVVYLPMEDMATECLHLLLDHIDGKLERPESRLLGTRYIARQSCGPILSLSTEQLEKLI